MATGSIDARIAEKILDNSINLYRLTAGERKKVIVILRKMQKDLIGNLASSDLAKKKQAEFYIKESEKIIADYYVGLHTGLDETLSGLSSHIAEKTNDAMTGVGLSTVMPAESHLKSIVSDMLIQGSPSKDWWDKQSSDTAFKFSAQVRQGIAQGETTNEIVWRIKDLISVSESNAAALVHTSVQTVANDARMMVFKENKKSLNGVQQLSTLDSHTSLVCVAYSGASYDLDGNPINGTTLPMGSIPRHFNCRSVWVPLVKGAEGIEGGQRFSDVGFIDSGTTFDKYLKMKTPGQQDDLLGKGRADLWRNGKITLSDLVNQRGRPLTIDELKKL
jgi:SPP1 gp7 family putative phage head morphogenesis protein